MKVLSCLKIPLTSIRFDCFASCETSSQGSRPRQLFSYFPTPRTGPKIPLEETLLWPVLKSFITVFIIIEGLENKLTRAPRLGLAKSIYYFINEMSKGT